MVGGFRGDQKLGLRVDLGFYGRWYRDGVGLVVSQELRLGWVQGVWFRLSSVGVGMYLR